MIRDTAAAIAVIEARRAQAFAWGSDANDCVSAAAAVVRAHRGVDLLDGLRWDSRAEADAVIASLGGLEAALSARMTEIAPAMAQRFDVALVELAVGKAVLIVEGDQLVGPGARAQMRLPRTRMLRAWTVGDSA